MTTDSADPRLRRAALAFAEVAGVLVAVLVLRTLAQPLLQGRFPYLGLYLAAIVVMLRHGAPATLAMLVAGALGTEWIAPRWWTSAAEWHAGRSARLLTFAISAGLLLPLLVALRRSRARLRQASDATVALEAQQQSREREARAADQRLAAVVRQAHDAIIALGPDGRVQSWNPAAQRLFGWTEAQMLGRSMSLLAPPGQEAEHTEIAAKALGGQTLVRDVLRRHQDGHEVPVRMSVAPMLDADQRVVGLSVVVQDIREPLQAQQALERSEATLRAFYDAAPVCMGVVELVGADDILHVYDNRVTCEVFGLPPGATTNRLASELGAPAETRRHWIDHYRASLAQGSVRFDYTLTLPDGRRRWMSATVCPVGGGSEGRQRFCYVSEDITDRKLAEQRLREADRQKDEFLAVLAHELRNPLAPLVSSVQRLRRNGDEPEARERALDMMDRQLAHMVRMVNDLLDVSRISQGRLALSKRPVALSAVVDDAVETSRVLIESQGHRLHREVDPALVVDVDPTRLAQVLANLLNNAAKYTPPGGELCVKARRDGDRVAVRVSDNGMGIPADQVEHVFDLFAQVDGHGEHARGGLGIGLAISRRLVELHGGTLEAFSDGPGRGSRFVVSLPATAAVAAGDASTPAMPPPETMPQGLKLVVADDNRDAAESLAELLSLDGHEVRVVHDGQQAVDAARAWRPDALLLDIGMPRLDGLQAASRIRAASSAAGESAPLLVAVSGWGQQSDLQRSAAAGFDHHLTKPVRLEELRTVLATPADPAGPSDRTE